MIYAFYSKLFFNSKKMGFCGKNVIIYPSVYISGLHNLYMYDNTILYSDSKILCTRAKFVMKRNSGAAAGFSVITGNHMSVVGRWFIELTDKDKDQSRSVKKYDKDVIVNEDVWIGTNVTLLSGSIIGRGAIIGSGSVCRNSVPPYSIVIGNPAKVIGFRFTPDEIIKHENVLYLKEERFLLGYLEKNYKKYFLDRIHKISEFTRL